MEPTGQVTLQVTLAQLVTMALLVILALLIILVKLSRGLTLPILEPMKVDSQMIPFMTLLLERTRLGTLMTMKMCLLEYISQILRLIQHLKAHLMI